MLLAQHVLSRLELRLIHLKELRVLSWNLSCNGFRSKRADIVNCALPHQGMILEVILFLRSEMSLNSKLSSDLVATPASSAINQPANSTVPRVIHTSKVAYMGLVRIINRAWTTSSRPFEPSLVSICAASLATSSRAREAKTCVHRTRDLVPT